MESGPEIDEDILRAAEQVSESEINKEIVYETESQAERDMNKDMLYDDDMIEAGEEKDLLNGTVAQLEQVKDHEKTKRNSLSLKEKLDLIQEIEKGEQSQAKICIARNLPKSTVYTIWQQREKIKAANAIHGRQTNCKRLRRPLHEELDQALYRWCLYAREKDEQALTTPILVAKAKSFAVSLGLSSKITNGWLDRFKTRHGIKFKSKGPEIKEEHGEQSWFYTDLPLLLDHKCSSDIYVVNEIGLFYQVLPQENQIMGTNGKVGNSQKVTLLLGANMTGSDRLAPLVIGSSSALSNLENTDTLTVSYCQDPNAWMTAQIWADWVRVFDRRMHGMRRKVLLFIDACPSHFVVSNLQAVTVHFLPSSCKHFMPIKQGIMQRFKSWYRKLVLRDMVDSINDGVEFQIDILSSLHFVRKAWQHISQDCIINAFKVSGWNHEDYQHLECVSTPIPTISQECYKLNISDSIFDHIDQEEDRMVTREELTDKVIIESVAAQAGASVYVDNVEEGAYQNDSLNTTNSRDNVNIPAGASTSSTSTHLDGSMETKDPSAIPGVTEARAAIDTLQSFIQSIEEDRAKQLEKEGKQKAKRSRKKAKVMSLCPEKGVFEIQEMKVDMECDP